MNDFADDINTRDFKSLVDSYKPSKTAVYEFINSLFAVIAGPAVSGKDTLRNGLIKGHPDVYERILSLTTRQPRSDETGDNAYKFIAMDEMYSRAKDQKLLQIAVVHNQQISAIDTDEIDRLPGGKIGLSILIVQTEQQLRKIKPDIKTVFLIPPSYQDLLERLAAERPADEAEMQRRLAAAAQEIRIALDSPQYYCIVSDYQQDVQKYADNFFHNGQINQQQNEKARQICAEILIKLENRSNND